MINILRASVVGLGVTVLVDQVTVRRREVHTIRQARSWCHQRPLPPWKADLSAGQPPSSGYRSWWRLGEKGKGGLNRTPSVE